jgi:hypothetical protein
MRPSKTRYQLWQTMLAIAVLAVLFAAFGVTLGTAIGIVIGVIGLPILLAPAGRRLRAAAWVCSIYPLLVLASLYATWLTAWCVLGHPPRTYRDDPGSIGPAVDVLRISTFLFIGGLWSSLPLGIPIWLGLLGRFVSQERIGPWMKADRMLSPLVVWPTSLLILGFGSSLFGVLHWFVD